MDIVIAGAHGQIALRLGRLLADADHRVIGLIRNPMHGPDLANAGVETVVLDLEKSTVAQVVPALRGADVVIFAAGAGPGSGIERKDSVDRGGASLLADAAQKAGVPRYILVSSMGVDSEPPADTDDVFRAYLRAKAASEEDLRARDIDWLILRPGILTNEDGVGTVELSSHVARGEITRDDVASVLEKLIESDASRLTLEVAGGDVPIAEAVARL